MDAVWALVRLLFIVLLAGVLSGSTWVEPTGQKTTSLQDASATVDSLRTAREFRTALACLDELNREHPHSAEVLWRTSILWSDLGKEADGDARVLTFYRQALVVAEEAISADPENGWAHVAKAVASGRVAKMTSSNQKSVRMSREVKEHVDQAIVLDSTLGAAYHIRARWHREVADLNFVQRMVVKAVYGGLPDASFEQAIADFQKAIDLEHRTYHHLELGKTYAKMGRKGPAREALKAALDAPWADPFDPEYKRDARKHLLRVD